MNVLSSNCPSLDRRSIDYTQRSIREQLDTHIQALADVNRSQQHQMHRHNVQLHHSTRIRGKIQRAVQSQSVVLKTMATAQGGREAQAEDQDFAEAAQGWT